MLAGIGTITTLALADNDGQELKTKTFFLRWSPIKILSSLPFFFFVTLTCYSGLQAGLYIFPRVI